MGTVGVCGGGCRTSLLRLSLTVRTSACPGTCSVCNKRKRRWAWHSVPAATSRNILLNPPFQLVVGWFGVSPSIPVVFAKTKKKTEEKSEVPQPEIDTSRTSNLKTDPEMTSNGFAALCFPNRFRKDTELMSVYGGHLTGALCNCSYYLKVELEVPLNLFFFVSLL